MPFQSEIPLEELKSRHADSVIESLSELEGIGGPEGGDYIDVMMQIAAHAITCAKNAADWMGDDVSEHVEKRFVELHDHISSPI